MESKLTKFLRGKRIIYKLLLGKITKKRIPIVTNILVTNKCNLNCFYCFPQVSKRKVKEMTTEQILNAIDESKKLGAEIIILLGGEPLIRDDIGEIINHIKDKKMLCEVITNGYFVKKRINDLKRLDSICISIDGDEEGTDKNRAPGSYKMAINALKLARENGIFTRIHAVITKNTINSIDHLVHLVKELDAVATFTQPSEPIKHEAFQLSEEEFKKAFTKILDYKRKGFPIANTTNALKYILKWPFQYNKVFRKGEIPQNFKPITCLRKKFTCYIDANGIVYPCAYLWKKCDVMDTNFLKMGFKESWEALDKFECKACAALTDVEMNMLLQLNLRSLFETGKSYIKENFYKRK